MPSFQQQNRAQQRPSPAATWSSALGGAAGYASRSRLNFQYTAGNQSAQPLQARPESPEARSRAREGSGFGHDFSRISVRAQSPPVQIQPKLTVSAPADIYEQEADRVSEHVMRLPDPQGERPQTGGRLQRKCTACEKEDEEKHDMLERKELMVASASASTVAPAIVHDVLNSPGQPLDAGTRGFFEARFGHDFSQVRIHTHDLAQESARAVDARAYTVKRHVVFGAGQYCPDTLTGRKLLAHELTHVMQQAPSSNPVRPADWAPPSAGSDVLRRKPDQPSQAERKRDQSLEELARDPADAHRAWKRLSQMERIAVAERMRQRYGAPFAQQFLDAAEKGKAQLETQNYQPGSGPTRDQLIARGYRRVSIALGNAGVEVERWVHPSGRAILKDISTWKPGAAETEKGPKAKAPPPGETKTKVPPLKPPVEPPLDKKQLRALELLDQLQLRNNELQDLWTPGSLDWNKIRLTVHHYNDADKELGKLMADPEFHMDDVDPDFYDEVEDTESEHRDLYNKFYELDPSFMSQPAFE